MTDMEKVWERIKKMRTPTDERRINEIHQLKDIIDCGTNAIRDAIALGGGDLVRINAIQKRMRQEAGL